MSDPDTILLETEDAMDKAIEYLAGELRGIRTGRASTALVEYLKVDCYGTTSDLKAVASISVPEPTQLLIKPFDPGLIQSTRKAIETSGLGLTPMMEGKQIRLNVPPLSGERRQQLVARCRKLGEETKVVLRNSRRDANKAADALAKQTGKHYPEDEIEQLKTEIQELLKDRETRTDERVEAKCREITEL
jgi:ribosome recycling factor